MMEEHFLLEPLDPNKFIKVNELKEITNPIFFTKNNSPTPDGLLSNEIFGITKDERAGTFAYIDLANEVFMHPLHYKIWGKLDSKIKDSVLLDVLANMINAVASLGEYLIGSIFFALTGDNIFPWADRIIFNGIAFLDINFLNPSDHSLFVQNGTDSILGKVVKNVYSTIFSLAVLLLGVAIGVMAIRLAISSIAAEKAKYKQDFSL